jgi:hypothetical protein
MPGFSPAIALPLKAIAARAANLLVLHNWKIWFWRDSIGIEGLLAPAYRHADYMQGFRKTEAGAYVRYEDAAIELPPNLPPAGRRCVGKLTANNSSWTKTGW